MAKKAKATLPAQAAVVASAENAKPKFSVNEALTECKARASVLHNAGLGLCASVASMLIVGWHLAPVDSRPKAQDLIDTLMGEIKEKGYKKSQLAVYLNTARGLALKWAATFKFTGPIADIAQADTAALATDATLAFLRTLTSANRPNGIDSLDALVFYVSGVARKKKGGNKAAATGDKMTTAEPIAKAALDASRAINSDKVPERMEGEATPLAVISAIRSFLSVSEHPIIAKAIRHSVKEPVKLMSAMFGTVDTPDEMEEILRVGQERLNTLRMQVDAVDKGVAAQAAVAEGSTARN
jgi:hypothetical protein